MSKTQTPRAWKAFKLDQLGFVGRGKSKHRPRNDPTLYGGPYPFIQTGDVKNANLHLTEYEQTYNEVGLAQSKLWDPGTLCITIAANIAETAILGIKACFPDSVVGFIAHSDRADVRFIKYYIDTIKLRMQNVSRGTTQDNLSLDKLLTFDFVVPAIEEQRRIADILSAYDDLIENNTKRIKILEEMARSLYCEWFVNFRFPGHEKEKSIASPVGKVPEGWEVYRLGDLVTDRRDAIDPSAVAPELPYFGLEHLPRRSIALGEWGTAGEVQSIKLRVRTGDILFGKIRPYFHKVGVAPVDAVCSSDAIVLRVCDSAHFGPVLCCVSSDAFVAHATQTSQGTKMPRASWEVLRKYPLPMPPARLLSRFNNIISEGVDMIQRLVLKNRNLRVTRDLLLPRLISGEIDVNRFETPRA